MDKLEYHTIDKSEWLEGPWKNEPDKMQWPDAITGYPCLIVRNNSGALCGYVGVTEGHPCFQRDYDNARPAEGEYFEVHGGLTFADFCQPGDEGKTICHIPGPGESDRVWWLGFDCAHCCDLMPGYQHKLGNHLRSPEDQYRDIAYVQNECANLARQLHAVAQSTNGEVAQPGSAGGS